MAEKNQLKQSDQFLKSAYSKALLPCMLSILSGNVNLLADGIIVGQKLGVNGLAALNLCLPASLILCVAGSFVVSGCAISTSIAIGKNKADEAQRFYHLSIGLCLIAALFIMAAAFCFPSAVTSILCGDESLRSMVWDYAGILLLGAAPKILLYVPFWYLRTDGRNRQVTIIMALMAGTNIFLDFVFLLGMDMGISGAALASVISTVVAALAGFFFLCDKKSGFSFGICFHLKSGEWVRICTNGSPAALNNLAQTFRILAVNSILSLYGSTLYIAILAPVNCVSEFSLCLIQGVPQAAMAMLGVYCGERDNGSVRILMRLQWRYGKIYTLLFGIAAVRCAGLIARLYGLSVSLYLPLLWLAISLFPALISGILSSYYNVSDHTVWANGIVLSRVFLCPAAGLFLLSQWHLDPWSFTLIGEVLALLLWWIGIKLYQRKHQSLSKYLLMDDSLERERKVLDFSVEGSVEVICDACERISDFCEENGMSVKQVMRMSLAMEELMTMILKVNGQREVVFDLRLFAIQNTKGIRFRYSGKEYNPFSNKQALDEEEEYLGVRMICDLAETFIYQRTFGMNMLRILI